MIPIVLGVFSAISVYMTINASLDEYVSPEVKAAQIIKAVIRRKTANDSYSEKLNACRILSRFMKRKMVEEDKKSSVFKKMVSQVCEFINFILKITYPFIILIYIIIFLWPLIKITLQIIYFIIVIKLKILIFFFRIMFI